MAKPLVAVVGRPNVGKSTLFNKIVGKRLSIVEDTPGVTRDRIYCDAEWRDSAFTLVDTGGIEPSTQDEILVQMRRQAMLAIEKADVVILVCDIASGVTAADAAVAQMLLKARKEILLCVNKVDRPGQPPAEIYEFYNLGLGEPYPVSSLHGMGLGELLDAVYEKLEKVEIDDHDEEVIKVAVIGKPNVGKSSLINFLAGEDRAIVSNIPGTTRDSVDLSVVNDEGNFVFIDTAGIRRQSKVYDNIEKYSTIRSYYAVDRADVALIMIDAQEGVTEQDTKIAGYAHEKGKACIIAVNKWDLIEKETMTMENMRRKVMEQLKYMSYAPVVFFSAKTGQRVSKMFDVIRQVNANNKVRVQTGVLNDVLADAIAKSQPPSDKGKRLRIYYMTQVSTAPPTFVIFVNDSELFHFSYQRYLENQIRAVFDFKGTPIRFIIREKGDESIND